MILRKKHIGELFIRKDNEEVYLVKINSGGKIVLEDAGGNEIKNNFLWKLSQLKSSNFIKDNWHELLAKFFWNTNRIKKKLNEGHGTGIFATKEELNTVKNAHGIDTWAKDRPNLYFCDIAIRMAIQFGSDHKVPPGCALDMDTGEFVKVSSL